MDMFEKLEMLKNEVFQSDVIEAGAGLINIPEWDSLAALTFTIIIEEEFGKHITGAEVREMQTVQDMLDWMEK